MLSMKGWSIHQWGYPGDFSKKNGYSSVKGIPGHVYIKINKKTKKQNIQTLLQWIAQGIYKKKLRGFSANA